MTERDRAIIETVERFRCLSREQIDDLFFAHCKHKKNSSNNVLKRLTDRKYLTTAPYRQPHVYLPAAGSIKKDSNKIDHYLSIADVYVELNKHFKVKYYEVEPRYQSEVRPDVFTMFGGTPFLIEVQNTFYTEVVMQKKFNRYEKFYESGFWKQLTWQQKDKKFFPYVILLSRDKYHIETRKVKVYQFTDVDEFINSLSKK